MSHTVGQLVDSLMELLNSEDNSIYPDDQLMLNVNGRWTGIAGITLQHEGLVLLDSED